MDQINLGSPWFIVISLIECAGLIPVYRRQTYGINPGNIIHDSLTLPILLITSKSDAEKINEAEIIRKALMRSKISW